ncbi:hypothetical protein [Streptomyces levis]|uniref:hypothetical protein n=1 Tax=Streptomyces levis TaxID=285566 RepID=UPI003C7B0D8F
MPDVQLYSIDVDTLRLARFAISITCALVTALEPGHADEQAPTGRRLAIRRRSGST